MKTTLCSEGCTEAKSENKATIGLIIVNLKQNAAMTPWEQISWLSVSNILARSTFEGGISPSKKENDICEQETREEDWDIIFVI